MYDSEGSVTLTFNNKNNNIIFICNISLLKCSFHTQIFHSVIYGQKFSKETEHLGMQDNQN